MYALLLPLIVTLIAVNLSYFRVKIDNEGLNYLATTGEVYAISLKYVFTIFIFILLFELLKKYYENQFYMIFKTDSMISAREESILKSNSLKKDKRVFAKVVSIISSVFIFYFSYINKSFDIGIIKKIFDEDSLKKHIIRESMEFIINYASPLFNAIVGISILYLIYKFVFPNFKKMIIRSLELLEKNSYKEIVFKSNSSDKNI